MKAGKRWRGWITVFVLLLATAAIAAATYRYRMTRPGVQIATAPARKGDFSVIVRCRGELKAKRSVQIVAPVKIPDLRILSLAPPGSSVKKGDTVIRFDPSTANQQLQEKDAALKQAQAALDQATAQNLMTAEQDQRDLSAARYAVERAKLEVSKQEIVSVLQGETSKIDLGLSEKDLLLKKANVELHETASKAKIASLTRVRDQAQYEVNLTKDRIAGMEIRAPLEGVIVYMPNYSQGWVNAKPFKVGDQVWPGAALAEIPDLSTLEMEGKVEEIDRGRIAVGQAVRMRVDSIPELTIAAKLTGLSLLTEMTFEWPPSSSFRGYSHVEKPDTRLRPGMNGSMDVEVQRLPNAISVPSKALFTRNGRPVVYVAEGADFRPTEVQVLARNPDEVAISGIPATGKVALVDLEKREKR